MKNSIVQKRKDKKEGQKMLMWMARCNVSTGGFALLSSDLSDVPRLQKSSLKDKAAEIKKIYNYKFCLESDDFMKDYPNIEEIEFVHNIGAVPQI